MKMKQCDVILKAMLDNKNTKYWKATDFQSGKYYVGYEATARMSDLVRMYPELFIITKDGRFRLLSINWDEVKTINEIKEKLEMEN